MVRSSACLVTGGAGFIGCALSSHLADRFDHVIALDSLLPQVHPGGERPSRLDHRVELVVGDVADPATWDALLAQFKPEVVLHLAAETGTGQSLTESSRHATANVLGTTTMLDALRRHEAVPKRLVLSSSRAVYGEGAWRTTNGEIFYPGPRPLAMLAAGQWDFVGAEPLPMNAATVEPRPASIYAVTKLAQEQLVTLWADAFGVQAGILRLQNVYGPGQTPANPYTGIMSLFCRLARDKQAIPLYEDGLVRRDFVFIDDVRDALLALVDAETCPTHPLDVGSGGYHTIAEAARTIAAHYGAPEPVVTGQFRHGDVRHAWADADPAADRLGYQALVSLADGVAALAPYVDAELDA